MLDRFASEQMIGLTSECVIDMSRNIQLPPKIAEVVRIVRKKEAKSEVENAA